MFEFVATENVCLAISILCLNCLVSIHLSIKKYGHPQNQFLHEAVLSSFLIWAKSILPINNIHHRLLTILPFMSHNCSARDVDSSFLYP
jgi:hypothetical protein